MYIKTSYVETPLALILSMHRLQPEAPLEALKGIPSPSRADIIQFLSDIYPNSTKSVYDFYDYVSYIALLYGEQFIDIYAEIRGRAGYN